jgi:hypothetical protein
MHSLMTTRMPIRKNTDGDGKRKFGGKEVKNMSPFKAYLKTMLTDTQIQALAMAVRSHSTVCLYGVGLGKSTLARIFRSAGIHAVLAPEDCFTDADCYSILDYPGVIALCMKNEPFPKALDTDSFSKEEIMAALEDALGCKY